MPAAGIDPSRRVPVPRPASGAMYADRDIVRPKFLDYTAAGAKVRHGTISSDRRSACAYAQAAGCHRPKLAVREGSSAEPAKPRLLDRVRAALRSRHYSRRTEEAYILWIRRYILFHGNRQPVEMGAPEITRFLTSLAVDGKVASSTQNQALSALLFLYREVLELDVPWLDGRVRAKRPERLPVVLTREEVRAVMQRLDGVPRMMAYLLYGAGLRVLECCRLRARTPTSAPIRSSSGTSRATRTA